MSFTDEFVEWLATARTDEELAQFEPGRPEFDQWPQPTRDRADVSNWILADPDIKPMVEAVLEWSTGPRFVTAEAVAQRVATQTAVTNEPFPRTQINEVIILMIQTGQLRVVLELDPDDQARHLNQVIGPHDEITSIVVPGCQFFARRPQQPRGNH